MKRWVLSLIFIAAGYNQVYGGQPPTITQVHPPMGSASGNYSLTIYGTNLDTTTAVYFGSESASFAVANNTRLTVTAPPGEPGPVDVTVVNPFGTSNAYTHTYTIPAPTVTNISPPSAPKYGGTVLTITGEGMKWVTEVNFGGTPGTDLTVIDRNTITVKTPTLLGDEVANVTLNVINPTDFTSIQYPFHPPAGAGPVIAEINPAYGNISGGQRIHLTGYRFAPDVSISFGGAPARIESYMNSSWLIVVSPAHLAGVVAVEATTSAGTDSTKTFTYMANPPPTINSLTQDYGATAGGTTFRILGRDFTGATQVMFGSIPAQSFTVFSDTEIEVVSPAGPAATVSLTVVTPGGTSNGLNFIIADIFPPRIDSISPERGTTYGGNPVIISGRNFTGATQVFFGSKTATFTVDSETQITATAPSRISTGDEFITVITPGGTSNEMRYSYGTSYPLPRFTEILPNSGPTGGGGTAVITGQYFYNIQRILFGTASTTDFTVDSVTQITVVVPTGQPGTVDVRPVAGAGTGVVSVPYTYVLAPPTVTSLSPNNGTESGGTPIIITGTNLDGATSVTFDGIPAGSFIVDSPTQITAIAPAHAVGQVEVRVTTPGGTGGLQTFTYTSAIPTPTITTLSPDNGPISGGTTVTITGTDLTSATLVTFGGIAATFTVSSPTQIIATSPAGSTGQVEVRVKTPGGTSGPLPFTYTAPPPNITLLSPDTGSETGGTLVTITGQYFTGATSVVLDMTTISTFDVHNDTTITFLSPPGTGSAAVTVTTPSGTSSPATFSFTPPPVPSVDFLTPDKGPVSGGTTVEIIGSGLYGATSVNFGSTEITTIVKESDTKISIVAPAGTAGVVNVTVTTPAGTSTAVPYTYVDYAPVISTLSPNQGSKAGGTTVIVTGMNLTGATAVSFGGMPATSFTVDSPIQITAVSPAGSLGPVDVRVTTPHGTSGTLVFTYHVEAPTIDDISPQFGLTTANTTVILTGTNFTGATAVKFGTLDAVSYTVDNDGQITAVTPYGTNTVPVTVQTPGGTGGGVFFSYVVPVIPVIASVSPANGPASGGNMVTLYGSGFASVTAVMFGSVPATYFTIDSDTQIRAVVPAGSVESVDIILDSVVGQSAPGISYTYENDLRPDPSNDPDVRAVVNAHVSSAERFIRAQSGSVGTRLQSIRRLNFTGNRTNDFNFRLVNKARTLSTEERRQAYAQLNGELSSVNCTDAFRGVIGQPIQTPWSFWTDGSINIGSNGDDAGYDYTTYNVTLGADYAFGQSFVAGLAAGYTNDKTEIGDHGSETSGHAYSVMAYMSYSPNRSWYIEGLIGYSSLELDSMRYTVNGYADGDRSGDQFFGSVATGFDIACGNFLVSPYGKFELSRSTLDEYRERGGGNLSLRYGKVDVDMIATSAGIRTEYAFQREWGYLTPYTGIEYTYNFKGHANARLGYTDQIDLPYTIRSTVTSSNSFSASAGLNATLFNKYSVGVEYRGTFANNRDNHRVSLQASWSF